MKEILIFLLPFILHIYGKLLSTGLDGGMNFYDEEDEDANIEEFPFTVILQVHYPDNDTFTCVGAYISQLWVLTAAQCIEDFDSNDENVTFAVKEDYITLMMGDIFHKNYQTAYASKAILHPSYDVHTVTTSTSLVKIKQAFNIRLKAQIVTLPGKAIDYIGSSVTVVGWDEETGKFKKAKVTIVKDVEYFDDPTNLIFVDGKLPGDCGGILVYQNMVIGVSPAFDYIFQNIYSHLSWINDQLGKGTRSTRSACAEISLSNCFEVLILFSTISKIII